MKGQPLIFGLKDFVSLWIHSDMSFSWLKNHGKTLCDNIFMWKNPIGERERLHPFQENQGFTHH